MADDRRVLDERFQLRCHFDQARLIAHLHIADAGQPSNELRDVAAGVDECGPLRLNPMTLELHSPNLNDHVPVLAEAGCLDINGYD